ncbi:MAG: 16S rRNA (cytidine(1402)-2'-O)-methyltransferase [Clostridiales bacterium]|jgi:16S rRNA (cytidine1402-2'-O)-methyltransferase|nr:16S rRNA (cytidine(1402)-2'-O)-methyltransferase [Clostridiales bacterium]
MNPEGELYVVATPIGNLGDISERALWALRTADFIACEDTRTSVNLLRHFGINTRLEAYHKFNEREKAPGIIERMKEGQSCALITDAGTPSVSDPGAVLVSQAAQAGIRITGIPGPSAAALAVSVCGFAGGSYGFYGFLPRGNSLNAALEETKNGPDIGVFYESPHRALDFLEAAAKIFPEAEVCCCNDLTKFYETIYRGAVNDVISALRANPSVHKGEYTIVVKKNYVPAPAAPEIISNEAALADIMVKTGVSLKEAVAELAARGTPKKEAYAASLKLKGLLGGR